MMDTVLNLGLNWEVIKNFQNKEKFALDSFRRFLQMFGDVVLGISHSKFEKIISQEKKLKNICNDNDFSKVDLKNLCISFEKIIETHTDEKFLSDPFLCLKKSIEAVFNSWNLPRAKKYREIHGIPNDLGTAVNIQTMVFGNLKKNSGTGVLFTRNPSTGEKKLYGEFLLNAQGEDVVAGIRTPKNIQKLEAEMPQVYKNLEQVAKKLEKHFHDMQDIEFTVENGKLFLLQTRSGKRTAAASVKIANDMINEKLISKEEVIKKIDVKYLDNLLHPSIDEKSEKNVIAKGLPASPGAAVGKIVFSADKAEEMHKNKEKVILVRKETSPEDIHGMHSSQGILTACGGMTSHAAVVARGMGKPCVTGINEMIVDCESKKFKVGDLIIKEGDMITIDGSKGEVILGQCKTVAAKISGDFKNILNWSKNRSKLKIFTNADTPKDAKIAKNFGAEGIGLCRTEHMFFEEDRIQIMREMIISETKEEREKALKKLLPFQEKDFRGIFDVMDGDPVTIRFLDPPLHEFLPENDKEIKNLADVFSVSLEKIKNRIHNLQEVNPMLGHRGCRLLITYPEVLKMQVQAILKAAIKIKQQGKKVFPEMMIPLVGTAKEFLILKKIIKDEAKKIFDASKEKINFKIGTMIEIPRACLIADQIAAEADFFSFGTNDLTQMTFGFSRDDFARFLPEYKELKIIEKDPFETIDKIGVGFLLETTVKKAKQIKPNLKISICGEHGGDPESIEFFNTLDITAVSCSPYRVPIARVVAAQTNLK